MTVTEKYAYRLGEFHAFSAGSRRFLYLVPSGGIFELDAAAAVLIDRIGQNELSYGELLPDLSALGLTPEDAEELVDDLLQSHVLVTGEPTYEPTQIPRADFPLQTLVLNLTNQCNLSCQYCYEYGEDKVATPDGKPKFMDLETAIRIRTGERDAAAISG